MAGELILGGWSCRGNSANPVFMGLAEFCRADYTGCGYFATVPVPLELAESLMLCEPQVTGTLGETVCSFVLHLSKDEVTLECEPCCGPDAAPDFREGAVVVASKPGNIVDLR